MAESTIKMKIDIDHDYLVDQFRAALREAMWLENAPSALADQLLPTILAEVPSASVDWSEVARADKYVSAPVHVRVNWGQVDVQQLEDALALAKVHLYRWAVDAPSIKDGETLEATGPEVKLEEPVDVMAATRKFLR